MLIEKIKMSSTLRSGDEFMQALTVFAGGEVTFEAFNANQEAGMRQQNIRLQPEVAAQVCQMAFDCIKEERRVRLFEQPTRILTDKGGWDLEVTDRNGVVYFYEGRMVCNSDPLRGLIPIEGLHLFG